jgi:hypothetical protein
MLNSMFTPECAFAKVIASRRVHVPVPVVAQALVESPASLTVTARAGSADATEARIAAAARRVNRTLLISALTAG